MGHRRKQVRIVKHPIIDFPSKKRVKFFLDEKEFWGYEGEPIAAALIDQGAKVFSHSPKYGRARGFFCAIGNCSSCLMRVNNVPNVRTCVEKLTEGMRVETQERKGILSERD